MAFSVVPALSASAWLNNENGLVQTVSLDPSKRQLQSKSSDTKLPPTEPTVDTTTEKSPTPSATEKASSAATISDNSETVSQPPVKSAIVQSSSNTSSSAPVKASPSESTSNPPQHVSEESKSASSPSSATNQPSEVVSAAAKVLPKYGSASVSPYKYIAGKPYHPSEHFHDLRGLSNDKSGTTNLIQVNVQDRAY